MLVKGELNFIRSHRFCKLVLTAFVSADVQECMKIFSAYLQGSGKEVSEEKQK